MWKSSGVATKIRHQRQLLTLLPRCSTVCQPSNANNAPVLAASYVTEPPPTKKKGSIFRKLLGLTLLGSGGVLAYAWYDWDGFEAKMKELPLDTSFIVALIKETLPSLNKAEPTIRDQQEKYLPFLNREKTSNSELEISPSSTKLPTEPEIKLTSTASPKIPDPDLEYKAAKSSQSPKKPAEEAVVKQAKQEVSSPPVQTVTFPAPPPPKPEMAPAPPVEPTPPPTLSPPPPPPVVEPPPTPVSTTTTYLPETATSLSSSSLMATSKSDDQKQKWLEAKKSQADRLSDDRETLEMILTDVCADSENAVNTAREALHRAMDATKAHTQLLKTAVEAETDKTACWDHVTKAYDRRVTAQKEMSVLLQKARETLDQLDYAIEDGRQNPEMKRNKTLYNSRKVKDRLAKDLDNKQKELLKVEREARTTGWYKDLLTEARTQLKKEVDGFVIGKDGRYTNEDWRVLVGHAHRRIEQLQQQLAEQTAYGELLLSEAVEKQKSADEKAAKQQLNDERDLYMQEMETKQEKWNQWERELLEQHARQMSAYSKQVNEEMQRELENLFVKERLRLEQELSALIGRHHGIEAALAARAENESTAHQAQELWLAAVALNGAIQFGNELGRSWEEQLKPLEKEVDTLFFAAKNNPFVCLVLDTVPEKALSRGVYTEENLVKRFDKVSRIAQRVALIDETGGSLFRYMLSYLQSALTITSVYVSDGDNDTVDLNKMNTFQLCGRAQYWIEKGDLVQALKFMNQLTGESRRVAADWIEEARLLLETKQAAQAVLAFASSTGLGTVF